MEYVWETNVRPPLHVGGLRIQRRPRLSCLTRSTLRGTEFRSHTLNGLAETRICPIQKTSVFIPSVTSSASVYLPGRS